MPVKVTPENWDSIQETIRKVGIKDTEDYPNGALKVIIANNGERFEFSEETFKQSKNAGLLKLGFRLGRKEN
jgi:hypothetical protein